MKAYLNGSFVESNEKNVKLEDRGLTFADGLFEVLRIIDGNHFFS
ncbi:MAG: hypothetical protein ACP5D6_05780 [Kosmotogaceae bacterium]